jgi:hypothetical protein
MPEIKMRPKHQRVLPELILREAKLSPYDKPGVTYTNRVIVLATSLMASSFYEFDLIAYAGIGKEIFFEG